MNRTRSVEDLRVRRAVAQLVKRLRRMRRVPMAGDARREWMLGVLAGAGRVSECVRLESVDDATGWRARIDKARLLRLQDDERKTTVCSEKF